MLYETATDNVNATKVLFQPLSHPEIKLKQNTSTDFMHKSMYNMISAFINTILHDHSP